MSITIKRVATHNLIKEPNSLKVKLDLSTSIYPVSSKITDLIEKLNKSYNSSSILYGSFEDPSGTNFVSLFDPYAVDTSNDDEFLSFTRKSLELLKDQISRVTFAKGGFFIFANYESKGIEYTGIYLIRDSDGILFNKRDGRFEIDDVTYIDIENLAMGCRIDMGKYLSNHGKHISFTRSNKQEISGYFINWISAKEAMSNREYTKKLYSLLNDLDLPKDDQGVEITIDDFRERAYTYIKNRPNNMLDLREMGTHFYDDPLKLINKASELNIDINTEFRADKDTLRKFTRVEVVSDDMNFKFQRRFYQSGKVRVSDSNPDQVIIESGSFARALLRKVADDQ